MTGLVAAAGPGIAIAACSGVFQHSLPVLTDEKMDQPVEFIDEVGGFLYRSILLKKAGTVIPQHKHDTDHNTLVCAGKGRLWVNGKCRGDYEAFSAVEVKAGDEHLWQALEANTRLTCQFDTSKLKGD